MVDLTKGNLRQRVKTGKVNPTEALQALKKQDGTLKSTRPQLVHWLQNAGQIRYEEAIRKNALSKEQKKREAEAKDAKDAKDAKTKKKRKRK